MIALFNVVTAGDQLYVDGEDVLDVIFKDALRIELASANDPRRTISFYASEFDEREFQVIPKLPPVRKFIGGVPKQTETVDSDLDPIPNN